MSLVSLQFTLDINGDGSYSGWELWEAVLWLYRLPGNLMLEGLGRIPLLSELFHIKASASTGYDSLNSAASVALSLVFWVTLFLSLCSRTSRRSQALARKTSSPPM